MVAAMMRRIEKPRHGRKADKGFTLIEVIISMAVMTVGLVSLLGVFGLAMASTQNSQLDMIAKQLANESYESLVTARNTSQISWDDIQNAGSTNCPVTGAASCGVFMVGMQPIYQATTTTTGGTCDPYVGLVGTTCDSGQPEQTIVDPGPDGIFGTADDVTVPLTAYQRQVVLTDVSAGLRSLTISVQYSTPQMANKSYILNTLISEYQ